MRRSLMFASLLATQTVAPASAGQPIEESLVECSVLVDLLMGEQSPIPGENEMLDFYASAATSMRRKATDMTSPSYVTNVADQKRQVWHDRWDTGKWDDPANRAELTDWWTYCFKLADHLKLQP